MEELDYEDDVSPIEITSLDDTCRVFLIKGERVECSCLYWYGRHGVNIECRVHGDKACQ